MLARPTRARIDCNSICTTVFRVDGSGLSGPVEKRLDGRTTLMWLPAWLLFGASVNVHKATSPRVPLFFSPPGLCRKGPCLYVAMPTRWNEFAFFTDPVSLSCNLL
ncbi:unnamed protein product [Protopolystoma xenopodis]|uniref:Uncharacterized protein n=1 Tax=Protopolystoma xenopodis TaxID=117903 RepID=A0A3S5FH80_9PLAT|nr:unnamed protein product [Protopolystoma xenopodis]